MLLRNLKAVNFLCLREVDVRNIPRRGVVGIEVPKHGDRSDFRALLSYALFGATSVPGPVVRPGSSFAYVEIELLHAAAGAVSIFRGTDRNGAEQVSLRESNQGTILRQPGSVEERVRGLLPLSPYRFSTEYLGAAIEGRQPDEIHRPPEESDLGLAGPEAGYERPREVEPAAQAVPTPDRTSGTLILAIVFSGLALLLFALLFAARWTMGTGTPFVAVAQVLVGILVVFNAWMAVREWRRPEPVAARGSGEESAFPQEPGSPSSSESPAAPPEAPAVAIPAEDGLAPDVVRDLGSLGNPEDTRFLVLSGRWSGDAAELLRCAGPSVSQVILLTSAGGTPPGSDMRLSVEEATGGGWRLTLAH